MQDQSYGCPFTVTEAKLLAELGRNFWDNERGVNERLFSESVMRKPLAKYSCDELDEKRKRRYMIIVQMYQPEKRSQTTEKRPGRSRVPRQVIGITVVPVVTEYHAEEFYDKKKGRNVHTTFPCGVNDDINYDESLKAFLFLLNKRCNLSKSLPDAPVMHADGTATRGNGNNNNVVVCNNGATTIYLAKIFHGTGRCWNAYRK